MAKIECSEETCKYSDNEGMCHKETISLRRVDPPEENSDGSERALLDCYSYEREEEDTDYDD